MKVFKFYPDNRAKFHFGDSSGKLKDIISSDQLFSALYNCAVLLYDPKEVEKILAETSHKILFSSLYYGIRFFNCDNGQSQEIFFLPRPLAPIQPKDKPTNLLNHKIVKKIKYVSLGAFRLLQGAWQDEEKYFNFDLLDLKILGGNFACTAEEVEGLELDNDSFEKIKLFTVNSTPRVVVSRLNDEAENFYYQEGMEVIYQQMGNYLISPFMYFICQGDLDRRLTAIIRFAADEGLGGKRSQGFGFLGRVVEEEWPDDLFLTKGQYYVSLSSIFPGLEEVNNLLYYELVERSGYIYSKYGRSLRKKQVRLLKEGSVFSGKISGQIVDISPEAFNEHKIYLNGKAFLIPVGEV